MRCRFIVNSNVLSSTGKHQRTGSRAGCFVVRVVIPIALAGIMDAIISSNGSYNSFHPVLDGTMIKTLPTVSIQAGEFQQVPLVVGSVF